MKSIELIGTKVVPQVRDTMDSPVTP
jgi:hypothetical protein